MSRYGNYPLKPKIDSIQRLYGMRFHEEVFKDQKFYDRICNSVGFAHFKVDALMYRFIKKTLWYKFTIWVIAGLNEITWLGLVNYFIQFLFIRIYKSVDEGKVKGYGILYFVLPLTGWFNNYVVLTKKLKFTKLIYKCK